MSREMPVLAATGAFYLLPAEATFEVVAEAGYDGLELMVTGDRVTQDAGAIATLAGRYGLTVPAVHGPFLLVTVGVFGADPRGKVARTVDLAAGLGATTVVIHPPYRWQGAYLAWLLEEIPRVFAERGIQIAVENMFPVRLATSFLEFHRGLDLTDFRRFPYLALDTSHLAIAGSDALWSLRELEDQVVHVHVSNNAGLGKDSHAGLLDGVLPIPEFLEELGAAGRLQRVTLELDVRPYLEDRDALLAFLKHNLEVARAHLAIGAERAALR